MTSELRSLFSPIQVGRLTLKNRIYSSAHAEAMAEGGRPGERLRRYHEADLLNKTVTETEIAICFLLGNLAYNKYILAISVGAVFFGANTYIGNGPNFMVKAIADQQKVRTPTFLAFVSKYTLLYMLPMLLLVWWIFFRD